MLLPRHRLGWTRSVVNSPRASPELTDEMQGSKHLLAPPGATPEVLKSKLIKEDHFLFACTTKMFEILVALPHQIRQTQSSRVTTWIVRTAQVHLSFRTHILAAIRLFTCQRASTFRSRFYARFSSKFTQKLYCKRLWQLSLPSS